MKKTRKQHYNCKSIRNGTNEHMNKIVGWKKELENIFNDPEWKDTFKVVDFRWFLKLFDYYIPENIFENVEPKLVYVKDAFKNYKKSIFKINASISMMSIFANLMWAMNYLGNYIYVEDK